ncbi:MAG: pilus assembly FimT family protein [Luteolibacter sp.]
MNQNLLSKAKTPGFTLIEVLTVVAIISILMTAAAVGFKNLSAGKGTSTGIAVSESLFNEARTLAVSKNTKSRLLIDGDPDSETFLRKILVVYGKADADGDIPTNTSTGEPTQWALSSRGHTFEEGTYFSQDYSGEPAGTVDTANSMSLFSPDPDITTALTNFGGTYFYYEFNSEGIISTPGTRFVIGGGRPPTSSSPQPRSVGAAARDFAGFIIWRNGRTSNFRSVEQMDIPSTPGDF